MVSNSPKTIVYVCNSASTGGANRSLSVILAGLDRERFRPVVVLPAPGPFLTRLRQFDVPTFILPLSSLARFQGTASGRAKGAIKKGLGFLRLLRLLDAQRAALVHTNTIFPLSGALGARLAGLPHVWHLREGLDTPQYDLRFGRRVSRSLIGSLSEHLICISRYVLDVSVPLTARGKATVIHNALEEIPAPRPLSDGKEPVVGCVGLLGAKKRTGIFVDMALRLSSQFPGARFVVAGRPTAGEEQVLVECQQKVETYGLRERFRWLGFVTDPSKIYDQIDLLVHPGVHEAFGRVLIEAMARGIPVVSVASGAVPELVEDRKTGRVVEPDNVEALADAAHACLDDPVVYAGLSRAARAAALARFSPDLHVRSVVQVYDRLLSS